MKILLIRTSSAENTIFKNIYNEQEVGLAKELTKLGYECGIVYFAKKGNASIQGIDVDGKKIKIYNIEGKEFCKSAIYNKEIYELCDKYDKIQIYECDKIMTWLINSRYPEKTIIYHGPYESKFTWKHNIYTKLFYTIFKNKKNYLNAHILTKSYLAEDYLRKQGFRNITTVGVGLDTEKFQEEKILEDVNILEKINPEDKNLLYLGKIEPRRNIKFLIDILADLTFKDKKVKLILIGNGEKRICK